MIELAAEKWQLSPLAAVLKLATAGIPLPAAATSRTRVENYVTTHCEPRRKWHELWKLAQTPSPHSSRALADKLRELGLTADINRDRWKAGPGQLFGLLPRSAIEQVSSRHLVVKNHAVKDWKQLIAFPFYDLPQRICGWLYISAACRSPADYVYARTQVTTAPGAMPSPDLRYEYGLSMHPNAYHAAIDWNRTIFGLEDPVVAAVFQRRHARYSLDTLPIAAWWQDRRGRTGHAWRSLLHGLRIVMATQEITYQFMLQVLAARADIAYLQGDERLREQRPQASLENWQKTARPWPAVFSRWLLDSPANQIEEMCLQISSHGHNIEELLRECTSAARSRALSFRPATPLEVRHRNHTVEERGDAWYSRRKSTLVVDAKLRIDHVVHYAERDRTYYQGRVIYQGVEVPFYESKKTVERNTFGWMQQLLIKNSLGMLRYEPRWNPGAVQLAIRFSPPTMIEGPDRIGWDRKRNRLRLPAFSLGLDGSVEPSRLAVIDPDLPASNLPLPQVMSPAEMGMLTRTNLAGQDTFWATTVLTITRIIAAIEAVATPGVGLVGHSAHQIGIPAAAALGCQTTIVRRTGTIDTLAGIAARHDWPEIVRVGTFTKLPVFSDWLSDAPEAGRCLVQLNLVQAVALWLGHDWHILDDQTRHVSRREHLELAPAFVSSYLADLCGRSARLSGDDTESNWLVRTLHDVADFVRRSGGEPQAVLQCYDRIWHGGDKEKAEAFGDLLCTTYAAGGLETLPTDMREVATSRTMLYIPEGLLIAKSTLVELLKEHVAPTFDFSKLTGVLAAAGILKEERVTTRTAGWVVDAEWWKERIHRWRSERGRLLQLHDSEAG